MRAGAASDAMKRGERVGGREGDKRHFGRSVTKKRHFGCSVTQARPVLVLVVVAVVVVVVCIVLVVDDVVIVVHDVLHRVYNDNY